MCPMIALTGLTLCAFALEAQTVSLGDKLYLDAKNLIENNCIDCMGGTKDGMQRGISEMQRAWLRGARIVKPPTNCWLMAITP